MKTFKKIYIGKGKKVSNLNIIKINFKLSDIVNLTHDYKGEEYLSFELAAMKTPDSFGHEYTAYVNKLEEAAPMMETSKVNEPKAKGKKAPKHQGQIPSNYKSMMTRME